MHGLSPAPGWNVGQRNGAFARLVPVAALLALSSCSIDGKPVELGLNSRELPRNGPVSVGVAKVSGHLSIYLPRCAPAGTIVEIWSQDEQDRLGSFILDVDGQHALRPTPPTMAPTRVSLEERPGPNEAVLNDRSDRLLDGTRFVVDEFSSPSETGGPHETAANFDTALIPEGQVLVGGSFIPADGYDALSSSVSCPSGILGLNSSAKDADDIWTAVQRFVLEQPIGEGGIGIPVPPDTYGTDPADFVGLLQLGSAIRPLGDALGKLAAGFNGRPVAPDRSIDGVGGPCERSEKSWISDGPDSAPMNAWELARARRTPTAIMYLTAAYGPEHC